MKPSGALNGSAARPPSEGRSSVSSHHNGSGLAMAVEKRLEAQKMLNEISEGRRVLGEENMHMEEMLGEEHHMVTNTDLAAILGDIFGNKSAILQTRKPVERLSLRFKGLTSEAALARGQKAQGETSVEADVSRRIVDHEKLLLEATKKEESLSRASRVQRGLIPQERSVDPLSRQPPSGKVNYAAMLEQQRDMAEQCDVQRRIYHTMIKEYVKNSNLGERFSGIL